ncbi:hypothetical protein BMF94_0486 [Rhodotorula taiwanensis]|uniref:Protein CPL1-like domain-containing protein n=1 Tax=Rhodotorula taiwanensis TaxID=741276 RepID=A0A2S5BHP8_9BASI|nr:hypothetical protein BMF94_0486 [Rhodotorula taiwanensis]
MGNGQSSSIFCGNQICLGSLDPNGSGLKCISGQFCGAATCDPGYTINLNTGLCVNLAVDPLNCGSPSNACATSWPNASPGAQCLGGLCLPSSCIAPYQLSTTSRACVSTNTDKANCGAVNKPCPSSYAFGGASSCQGGVCTTTCNAGYGFDSTYQICRPTIGDVTNCGSVRNVCQIQYATQQTCPTGICLASACASGYLLSADATACIAIDINTNVNNCGGLNKACAVSGASSQRCVSGQCQATACLSGLTLSSSGACIDLTSSVSNCGGLNRACAVSGASSQRCVSGQCQATACIFGLTLTSAFACVDLNTSLDNCGTLGFSCTFSPAGASGACILGSCIVTSCPTPKYTLVNGACKLAPSGRARAKRDTWAIYHPFMRDALAGNVARTLCPSGEEACPIEGSSTFDKALALYKSDPAEMKAFFALQGGYECLDTTEALESCGGCASTGAGRDCTAIPHVGSTACQASTCLILSCAPGYRRSITGDRCLRVKRRKTAQHGREDPSANATTATRHRHYSKRSQFVLLGDSVRKHP